MPLTREQQIKLQEISNKYEDLEHLVPSLKSDVQPAFFQICMDGHDHSDVLHHHARNTSRQEVFRLAQQRKLRAN